MSYSSYYPDCLAVSESSPQNLHYGARLAIESVSLEMSFVLLKLSGVLRVDDFGWQPLRDHPLLKQSLLHCGAIFAD